MAATIVDSVTGVIVAEDGTGAGSEGGSGEEAEEAEGAEEAEEEDEEEDDEEDDELDDEEEEEAVPTGANSSESDRVRSTTSAEAAFCCNVSMRFNWPTTSISPPAYDMEDDEEEKDDEEEDRLAPYIKRRAFSMAVLGK